MLRMLIVDDEKIIREGIQYGIDWAAYDIEVIASASDGLEALEIAKTDFPDILITDICMPAMDGIALVTALKEMNRNVSTIILTGHDEFEYAHNALELGVDNYILKPVDPDILIEKVLQNKNSIEKSLDQAREYEELKAMYEKALPVLRERFILDILEGNIEDHQEMDYKMLLFDIKSSYNFFQVALIRIDNYNELIKEKYGKSFIIDTIKIHSLITNECKQKNIAVITTQINPYTFSIIFPLTEDTNTEIIDLLSSIKLAINEQFSFYVTIGVGNPYENFKDISRSYMEANEALQYKIFTGSNQIISINDIVPSEKLLINYSKKDENDLMTSLKTGNKELAIFTLNKIFTNLKNNKNPSLLYVQKVCAEILIVTSRTLQETITEIAETDFITNDIGLWQKIFNKETIDDLHTFLLNIYTSIFDLLEKERNSKGRKIIDEVKKFLSLHYFENIRLSQVAEEFKLSYSYLSLLFKKETGYNLTEYLNMIRIEQSKLLLKDPTLKIYEVGTKIGIEDSHYFTRLFKKLTGISPTEYRDRS